jgi:hypothetical protein
MWTAHGEDGQATVELVAALPALVAIALLAWQAVVAGEAWWLASAAAREAARAEAIGGDSRAAAVAVLPGGLRSGLSVSRSGGEGSVRVRLAVPPVFAGIHVGSVTVRAAMEPQS